MSYSSNGRLCKAQMTQDSVVVQLFCNCPGRCLGSDSRNFYSYGDITSHQILSFVCKSWPFKQRGFLSVLLLFWHPFIMVISEDPWHSHLLPSYWQRSCHYLFYDWGLSRLGFEHPTFRMRGERPKRLRHRSGVPSSLACCWWPNREDVPSDSPQPTLCNGY